jgi:hypothetical protein
MRLSIVLHGALLLIALFFAYQTATREETKTPEQGSELVWKMSKVSAIYYETESKTVRVEARVDEQSDYLWGKVTRTRTVPAPKKKPDARSTSDGHGHGSESHEGEKEHEKEQEKEPEKDPEPEVTTTVREFPVGSAGKTLLEGFQTLMALRKLGPLSQEQLEEYELHENTVNLTVFFDKSPERTLLLAKKSIYGGTDRYAIDMESNIGYVISGKLVQPLESAENSLRIKKTHLFETEQLHAIDITTTKGDKRVLKKIVPDEKKKGERVTWQEEGAADQSDQTLTNFIDRVSKLRATQYETELKEGSLVHIATLRYLDEDKKPLGFLELSRQLPEVQPPAAEGAPPLTTQYFIKTERTRSQGKVSRLAAERIDQDLVEIFGIAPPPKPPAPPTPPTPKPTPRTAPTPVPPVAPPAKAGPAKAGPAKAAPAKVDPVPEKAKPAPVTPPTPAPASSHQH